MTLTVGTLLAPRSVAIVPVNPRDPEGSGLRCEVNPPIVLPRDRGAVGVDALFERKGA